MRRFVIDIAIVASLSAVFLAAFGKLPSKDAYFYDEADYIIAGSRGLAANYLERPSMPVGTFLRTGMGTGLDTSSQANRASLSDMVRGSKDITFFRHYHGPVYFYWLAALGPVLHFNEYAMRCSGLVLHALAFAVIYFGVLALTSQRIAALLSGCLFLFGQSNIGTDTQITPHIPYVLFTIAALLIFAKYLQTGKPVYWYAWIPAFAGAFCSIDYAVLLPITVAISSFFFPERRPSMRTISISLLLFLGCLLILWPTGLLQLSAVKGYFYIAYLAMRRKGSYGDDTPLNVWLARLSASPVEYAIFAAGVLLMLFALSRSVLRTRVKILIPFLVYAALMLLTTLKNTSLNPTYVSSILPALAVIAGAAIAANLERLRPAVRAGVAVALLGAIAAGGWQFLARVQSGSPRRPEAGIMAFLRDSRMEKSNILVPYEYLPAMSFYFPEMQLHAYLKTDNSETLAGKVRHYGAQAIVVREPEFETALARGFRLRAEPVPASPGYSLIHVDGII